MLEDRVYDDLHVKGAKDDRDKPRLDLVLGDFANALWAVGEVGTFGANKYCDRGWHEVPNAKERYANALLRHYFKMKKGEYYDNESGLLHLSHLAWNALALLQLEFENIKISSKPIIEEIQNIHPDFQPIIKVTEIQRREENEISNNEN